MTCESLMYRMRTKTVLQSKCVKVKGTWLLTLGCEFVSPQWWQVALHSIKARRNQDHIRGKLISNGHHYRSAEKTKACMIIPQFITVTLHNETRYQYTQQHC